MTVISTWSLMKVDFGDSFSKNTLKGQIMFTFSINRLYNLSNVSIKELSVSEFFIKYDRKFWTANV